MDEIRKPKQNFKYRFDLVKLTPVVWQLSGCNHTAERSRTFDLKVAMRAYAETDRYELPQAPPLLRIFTAVTAGILLFLAALFTIGAVYEWNHTGKIYPGVSVAGIDVSGMDQDAAAALLAERLAYPDSGRIIFQDGDQVWTARPVELGLYLDPKTSAQAAYSLGRESNPFARLFSRFGSWYSGRDMPPLFVFDQRVAREYLQRIAEQVDQPVVDAYLQVEGLEVISQSGQVGRTLDVEATLAPLEGQLRSMSDGILPLVIEETYPEILDVSAPAEKARRLLSAPLTLSVPDPIEGDPGPWVLDPERLAGMLKIERLPAADGPTYAVNLDPQALRTFLAALAPALERTPQDARFIFNDDTRQLEVIQPSVTGRSLSVESSLKAIYDQLEKGENQVPLALTFTEPAVSDKATAESLGITELVSSHTTYFYGSSASRIHNIETAAGRFHGVLVPPGETFSMADILGDVSLDTGYAEALIIYGDRTIEGVGGGVCQVSTTLFRTVFMGGFPVVERHPHAYRVYYYELNAANQVDSRYAGLDATVYVPLVDFKFKNDTPNWILMETYTNAAARTLTWKFYSTSDGRTVEWDTTGLQNIEEPPDPVYVENPDLAKGEIKQVDWGVKGADVTVDRTVYRDGQVYFEDSFSTHYVPWKDMYEYGPGTKIPDQDKKKKNND